MFLGRAIMSFLNVFFRWFFWMNTKGEKIKKNMLCIFFDCSFGLFHLWLSCQKWDLNPHPLIQHWLERGIKYNL